MLLYLLGGFEAGKRTSSEHANHERGSRGPEWQDVFESGVAQLLLLCCVLCLFWSGDGGKVLGE